MAKSFWLFGCPMYSDEAMRNELDFYAYFNYSENERTYCKHDTPYINKDQPCLVLRNLIEDLFFGNKVYDKNGRGKKNVLIETFPLIITKNPEVKNVSCFFPFFTPKKEYESRFKSRKESKNNPYANQLCVMLLNNPKECIEAVEKKCKSFFSKGCTIEDENKLQSYLESRVDIFIDYIKNDTDGKKHTPFENGSSELKERTHEAISNGYNLVKENRIKLLARLLILSGLCWDKINTTAMCRLFVEEKASDTELECDKYYALYCEGKKTNKQYLREAYKRLPTGEEEQSKYTKEISSDYAEYLMSAVGETNKKKAVEILTSLSKIYQKYGKVLYLLGKCKNEGIGCKEDKKQARGLFKKAAECGDPRALLLLAEEHFSSSVSDEKEKAIPYCEGILALPPHARKEQLGRAAFILAEIYFSIIDDKATARDYYIISADAGYASSRNRLRQLDRPNRQAANDTILDKSSRTLNQNIIVSGCKDVIESLKSSLKPSEWNMMLISESPDSKSLIREKMIDYLEDNFNPHRNAKDYPERSVFVFAESDENVNLRNALHLLDRLYNVYNNILVTSNDENDERLLRLMRSFDIYLSADYETASTMIDASVADMGDKVYFKIHICDTNKLLSEQLLYRAPLFIPSIRGKDNPNVVTFGSSDFIYNFIREATASTYMDKYPVTISAIDKDISKVENKFKQNCGGICSVALKHMISPCFFSYDLSRADLDDIASCRLKKYGDDERKINEVIKNGNYFVVDVGSDMENVMFAKNLRTWLLRGDKEFKRIPFIAVRCRDSVNAYWISRLHSGGGRQDPHWYNDYDFYIFGMMNDIYPHEITDATIEKIALGVHLSYADNPTEREIARFWQSSYRRDSSCATAVGLVYRLFDAGICLNNYRDYHRISFSRMAALADSYEKKLKADSKLACKLAKAEQARWNCFMLSRGWLPATPEEVNIYAEALNYSSHRYDLCKLHPYILDWEDIGDGEDSCCAKIKKTIPTASSPKDATVQSINSTFKFFRDITVVPCDEKGLS